MERILLPKRLTLKKLIIVFLSNNLAITVYACFCYSCHVHGLSIKVKQKHLILDKYVFLNNFLYLNEIIIFATYLHEQCLKLVHFIIFIIGTENKYKAGVTMIV